MPLLALVTGPLGKIAGIAALALGLLAAGALALRQHDARVLAQAQVAQDQATMRALQSDHARDVAALQTDAAAARWAAQRAMDVETAIDAAPKSSGCRDRAAIAAAVDRMRLLAAPDGADAAAADPGEPARVPAAAGSAGARR